MKSYSCNKCPGYCCSYPEIEITKRDIARLAKHLDLTEEQTEARYTKGVRLLRHQKDTIFDTTCVFLDQKSRRCTVYDARPGVCRGYPDSPRCGYYEFLKFERAHQGDHKFIALT
jgi:Fe-S-cluster containining protein